ncbi:NAD(P)-binding domain-containing protein [Bradyrhizobium sp. 26S5]|uniref:NAD(P)-binding domain-containing protein n=1 Tax=Bradyrhizobium sp. 26S5 TaxID=3139729 RepID=UPI0030D21B1B
MFSEASSQNPGPNNAKRRIGLVGVGRMGTGIGISLMRHQIELHIKANKNRFGADRLATAGACEHPSIAELAQHVSAVVLSLPSSREVEAACLGQDGLFVRMSRGGLIIDCTTSYPTSTVALAEQAQERGLGFVDAPVTRSPEQAELGLLNAIVGSNGRAAKSTRLCHGTTPPDGLSLAQLAAYAGVAYDTAHALAKSAQAEPPSAPPVLTSLSPDTAVSGDPDFVLSCIGTGFDQSTTIIFGDYDEETTLVSDTE